MTLQIVANRPETRILREAACIIARNGIAAINVRGLAKAAGTSTSQFVQFYGTVDSLLIAVLDHGCGIIHEHIDVVFNKKLLRTPEMAIDTVLIGLRDAYEANPESVAAALKIALHLTGQGSTAWRKSKHAVFLFRYPELLRLYLLTHLSRQEGRAVLKLLQGALLHWWVSALHSRTAGSERDQATLKSALLKFIDGVYQGVT